MLSFSIPAQARLGVLREALQRRYEAAMVFVGLRTGSYDDSIGIPVECQAITEDGSVYSCRWELQPLRAVEPVFLEPQPETKVASVRIEIRDRDGRMMPMDIRVRGSGTVTEVRAPDSVLLPYGTYRLSPHYTPRWLLEGFDGATFEVSDALPTNGLVTVVMPEPLCLLRLQPRFDAKPRSVIHIALVDSKGGNHGMMNLAPTAGPWEIWVPRDKMTMKVQSASYVEIIREIDIASTQSACDVEFTLEPRQPR